MDYYLKHRGSLNSFDVICCDSKDLFWRYIGHTAIVYRDRAGVLYVLESTHQGMDGQNGVQVHRMGEWVAAKSGRVSVRRLMHDGKPKPQWGATAERLQGKIESFINEYYGTSYPPIDTWGGKLLLALARLDIEIAGKDILVYQGRTHGVFCTQTLGMLYQAAKLMTDGYNPRESEPRDVRGRFRHKTIKMIDGISGKPGQFKTVNVITRQRYPFYNGKFEKQMRPGWSLSDEILIKG